MNDDTKPGMTDADLPPKRDGRLALDLDRLSSLVDGELDADAVALGCRDWCEQPAARAAWHRYHLIGDVMRSEHLSSSPQRDEAFLQAFRVRLASEPVVLAPEPVRHATEVRRPNWRQAWFPSVVVAAGFAAVAGVLVVTRLSTPGVEAGTSAIAAAGAASSDLRRAAASVEPAPVAAIDQQLVRDARLDRYFEAHRGALTGNSFGVPGGSLRSVDIVLPQR